MRSPASIPLAALLALGSPALGRATEPVTLAGGRLTLGGEVSATVAPDDPAFFNYNDYAHSLQRFRLSLTGRLRMGGKVALMGEVLSENLDAPRPYALYVRVRPWTEKSVDVQAGLVPPVFGAFARRRYGADNPLIGYPLAYQYLTSLRNDAAPASPQDLLAMRGRGWLARYPIGDATPRAGSPLANALRWDTGVQVRVGSEPLEMAVALTQGTLSHPRFEDDNDGKQVSARLGWHPVAGLLVGLSGARGEFFSREVQAAVDPAGGRGYFQRALGADAEYSSGYWLVRAEAVWSSWDAPPGVEGPLRAAAVMLEGRYKLAPGLAVAARVDRLGFNRIPAAGSLVEWDAPVTRIELGAAYSLRRNLTLKAVYQYNRRDNTFSRRLDLGAAQLVFWF
jgi:hypothetical protein